MLFNSIEFAFFLPLVFILYWGLKGRIRSQNVLLLLASYVFYGWWDWRFLTLIIFSSFLDFTIGIQLDKTNQKSLRKLLLGLSLLFNLGMLGFFKYYNFFIESFVDAFTLIGVPFTADRLSVILPVGISFYTFQTLSYTIDVYKRELKATNDWVAFYAFVSFFPQLVAGPIERASNLLPQFSVPRFFDTEKAKDGLRQILWGLFKKIVIADNCAHYANEIFTNYEIYSGSTLVLGAIFFTFQIYGDFSGYSDIAIGTARLFGFNLMQNFAFPYFSRDIAEFWRRWHISLSTWFRDYVYIPLGGSRGNLGKKIRNVFIIFLLSGFWHGANWTFIVWGGLNALYFLPLLLANKNRTNVSTIVAEGRILPNIKEGLQMAVTFGLTVVAWVFFRAESIGHALLYLKGMFSPSIFALPENRPMYLVGLILLFVLVEWLQRDKQFALDLSQWQSSKLRWGVYYILIAFVFVFSGHDQEFIYFQF